MKKTVLRLMSAVLALMMVLSLAACGDTPASSSAPESSSKTESKTSSASEPESKPESSESSESSAESKADSSASDSSVAASDGTYPTVTAFMQDNRDVINASIESIAGNQDEMEVSLDCTDDSLIYKFVFTESAMAEVDESALTAALEEQIDNDSFTSTFEGIADSIKSVVPQQDTVKVEVIYAKADGTELVHKTYSSGAN